MKIKENSASQIGKNVLGNTTYSNSQEIGLENLFKIVKIAVAEHPEQVFAFLKRLSFSNKKIQDQLAILNQADLNSMRSAGRKNGNNRDEGEPEVVIPAASDIAGSDNLE